MSEKNDVFTKHYESLINSLVHGSNHCKFTLCNKVLSSNGVRGENSGRKIKDHKLLS